MAATNKRLREAILSALTCRDHFDEPTIINNDTHFSFGRNPIVICSECVERLRRALGLSEWEPVPTHEEFMLIKQHEKKR